MIEIEIDTKKYNLPTGWNEINLEMFKKITEFDNSRDYSSEVRKSIDLIALLLDCDPDLIMGLNNLNFKSILSKINWVKEEIKGEVFDKIVINNITYITPTDMNNLSMGEIVSLETILKTDPSDIAGMLSILLRPSKKVFNVEKNIEELEQEKFNTKDYLYRKELFIKELMITDVINISSFFLNGESPSSILSRIISEKEV